MELRSITLASGPLLRSEGGDKSKPSMNGTPPSILPRTTCWDTKCSFGGGKAKIRVGEAGWEVAVGVWETHGNDRVGAELRGLIVDQAEINEEDGIKDGIKEHCSPDRESWGA